MTDFVPQPHHVDLLHAMLQRVVEYDGSDLHVREGMQPFMRRHGTLMPIPESTTIDAGMLAGVVGVLTANRPLLREEFDEVGEADLSYQLDGVARFRVNMFKERGKLALTLRVISNEVPHIDSIGVPPVIKDLAMAHHGLVLVTGATGSGKTTTLAAMIDHRNRHSAGHILTIEDPIEIVHSNHSSIVSQREVGTDTRDFGQGLRRALRQDPDVILIGEIRDEETMRTALAAAETGHLVLATLHTINAQETIARVLDLFPSEAESQARAMLAGALKGIVSQRLAKTTDGKRTAVVEVLVSTARIADCINNPEETGKINEAIGDGEYYGMQTFDQALIKLIMQGRISEQEALHLTTSPQNFKLTLASTQALAQVEADRRTHADHAAAQAQQPTAAPPTMQPAHAQQQPPAAQYAQNPHAAPRPQAPVPAAPGAYQPVGSAHTPLSGSYSPTGAPPPVPQNVPPQTPPPPAPGGAPAPGNGFAPPPPHGTGHAA
ncbi:MAG: Type pili twitching motility protein PilT [Thermoleophilia bacterium]|nr:Type pili twitching motility protein PilT [Thermoleophilia bacterium]